MIEHTRQADDRVCYSWLDYRLDCCYTQESKPQVIIYTRTYFVSLAFCMEHGSMEQATQVILVYYPVALCDAPLLRYRCEAKKEE